MSNCRRCGGKRPEGSSVSLHRSTNITMSDGMYATSTNCSGPYRGQSGGSLWVVGIGTEHEEAFASTKERRAAAIRKAQEQQLTIDHLPAHRLCHELVVAALGA